MEVDSATEHEHLPADMQLYIPVAADQAEGNQDWLCLHDQGTTTVLAFTSQTVLEEFAGARAAGHVRVFLDELLTDWPEGWLLAIDPGAPDGRMLAPTLGAPAGIDAAVDAAVAATDWPALLEVLLRGRLFLLLTTPVDDAVAPAHLWQLVEADGSPAVAVFTSRGRLDAHGGHAAPVRLVDLLAAWPQHLLDSGVGLTVNPDHPVGATLEPEGVREILHVLRAP
jgi:SseB protein N-terminal domain